MKYPLAVVCLLIPVVLPAQDKPYPYTVREITDAELYERQYETRSEELELKANRDTQETAVHRQRLTVKKSASGPARSASSVEGVLLGSPGKPASLDDRLAASIAREPAYPGKAEDVAVMEAVFRRMLQYRELGFAEDVTTFFLGSGEFGDEPPALVIERLQQASDAGEAGLTMLPVSRAMLASRDGILDRRTLERGVVLRVDSIERMPDGSVKAIASFSERDAFYFTKEFRLRAKADGNFEIVSEQDYSPR